MENSLIAITLVLLMLSLVTERITNFIKLYLPALYTKIDNDPIAEKRRERQIQLLAMLIGVVVAFMSKANFFQLVKNKGVLESWEDSASVDFLTILGCSITGIFLSQGSKFFHDLLDTLLYFKNTKRMIMNNQQAVQDQLNSGENVSTEQLIATITAEERQDEQDNNL
jgi:hypothetical protein